MSFSLIVTADDFGFGPGVSRGIIQAHLHGPVTATSAMAICHESLNRCVPMLEEAPQLELGLHFVLTGGLRPLTNLRGSGLVDRAGNLLGNDRLWVQAFSGKVNRRAVYQELCEQARMFTKIVGQPPAYVDAHHHAHQLPCVREALVQAMKQEVVPSITRLSIEPPWMRKVGESRVRRTAANFIGQCCKPLFKHSNIQSNDYFFGMLSLRELSQPFPWYSQVGALRCASVVEWVVHPGEFDESIAGHDTYVKERAVELAALTDPALRVHWQRLRPFLTTKSHLFSPAR